MQSSYDFIIVGAGTAGCVLAQRLSQQLARNTSSSLFRSTPTTGRKRILLLEAGNYPVRSLHHRPSGYFSALGSYSDWADRCQPSFGHAYRRFARSNQLERCVVWPSGKVLGGSSSLNAMIYMRGAPSDYDAWDRSPTADWSFATCEPYFRKLEDDLFSTYEREIGQTLADSTVEKVKQSLFHGSRLFLDSAVAAGQSYLPDLNSSEAGCGVGSFQTTIVNHRRQSAWTVFQRQLEASTCLELKTNCLVQSLGLKNDRATSVILNSGECITANQAIVLCAGAIRSPGMLMRSGIGDRSTLLASKIDTRIDLPHVGQHLQDHLSVPIVLRTTTPLISSASFPDSNRCEVGGFFCLDDSKRRDFQWHVTPNHYLKPTNDNLLGNHLSVSTALLKPTSEGRVWLTRAENGAIDFQIAPNYLDSEKDLEQLAAGVESTYQLLQTEPLRSRTIDCILPHRNCDSREQWKEHVCRWANTIFHPTGTCRISNSLNGVVDPGLKVLGTSNLFIADNSVVPAPIRGNTQGTAMMIGARCAEFLLSDSLS